ncbi:MAG TPA: hypothetical protein PL124_12830, partial [Candidatus Cloacimonadota bacterium]|nr:hypothetical protein [Candidatus Cloacimonadota bacterium]
AIWNSVPKTVKHATSRGRAHSNDQRHQFNREEERNELLHVRDQSAVPVLPLPLTPTKTKPNLQILYQ